ncbi:MAG: hypothetical protein M1823_003502 [Watsoniomyces obsoletus]|nr:MAG: hypothetical protein M1823_003502 [Watsoniomyces obsoletus]
MPTPLDMTARMEEPDTHYPSPENAGSSIRQAGFRIETCKLPILRAGPIEQMTSKLGITPPEMIFGDNVVAIEHVKSGWGISFNAFDALDLVDKTGAAALKVAYSKEWQKNREKVHQGIKEVVKPFDWSYTTDYKGTIRWQAGESVQFTPCDHPIPFELLRRPDPILFFDNIILYEDELADNGISMLSCKIRVMPARLLLLLRFFLRLDDVIFRLRDTRVYIDFETKEVIREYVAREADFESVRLKAAGSGEDVTAFMRDDNKLAEVLPVVEKQLEHLLQPHHRPTSCIPTLTRRPTPSFLRYRQASTTPSTAPSKQGPPSQNLVYNIPDDSPTTLKIAREVRDRAKTYTETYIAYGATEKIYKQCAAQADYSIPRPSSSSTSSSSSSEDQQVLKTPEGVEIGIGTGWWYTTLSLPPTFSTWSQITMLHIWIFVTRFRCFPGEYASAWQQHLLDHFFEDAERHMIVDHGLNLRSQRSRYLKDLHVQYRGILAAYDEGIFKGDAVLATALWRNVFAAKDEVDLVGLAIVTAHVRNAVRAMELIPDEGVVGGRIEFADPKTFETLVKGRSRGLEKPFSK